MSYLADSYTYKNLSSPLRPTKQDEGCTAWNIRDRDSFKDFPVLTLKYEGVKLLSKPSSHWMTAYDQLKSLMPGAFHFALKWYNV